MFLSIQGSRLANARKAPLVQPYRFGKRVSSRHQRCQCLGFEKLAERSVQNLNSGILSSEAFQGHYQPSVTCYALIHAVPPADAPCSILLCSQRNSLSEGSFDGVRR